MDSKRVEVGEIVEISSVRMEELTVEWRIPNFLSLPGGSEDWYASPWFQFSDERWFLKLWPNGSCGTEIPSAGWVGLSFFRNDKGSRKYFRVIVGIKGSEGVEMKREAEGEISNFTFWSLEDFCSRNKLMEQEARLMPEGVLTIKCTIKTLETAPSGGLFSSVFNYIHSKLYPSSDF